MRSAFLSEESHRAQRRIIVPPLALVEVGIVELLHTFVPEKATGCGLQRYVRSRVKVNDNLVRI
jgi:hypothetical protein